MIVIDKTLSSRKANLLTYFRDRAQESLRIVRTTYGDTQLKERAGAINKALGETCETVKAALKQTAQREGWTNEEVLKCVLMITYAHYVVMLESRNDVWEYEYMSFSRRIGELWDPFCKLCFNHPVSSIALFVPPLFTEVQSKLTKEINDYIDKLSISTEEKKELKKYYQKVWSLVTSGEIQLELDLHFVSGADKIGADFKSGFGSNEKGNTTRHLLVGTIYKNLEEKYKRVMLVRSEEDKNNNYFQIIKRSGVWEAYCGDEAYGKVQSYTGFDIKSWIANNIHWEADLKPETLAQFKAKKLDQCLKW